MVEEGHVIDLIPAYALDCLDDAEDQVVSAHLVVCAQCRAELQTYQEVAGEMAFAVPQVEPPADLKAAIMARVSPVSPETQAREIRSPWWQRWSAALPRISPAWGIASLVLILVLGASNILLWRQVSDLRAAQPAPLQVVALGASSVTPGATGMIVISKDGYYGTLVVDRLPALDESKQYQLWLIKDGKRDSGGVFSVSSDGYGSVWIDSPQPLDSYSGFGITIEPQGGSPGPTGEKVLGSDL